MRIQFTLIFLLMTLSAAAQEADSLQYVLGRFEPSEHSLFKLIPTAHASKDGMYLRKEALDAFVKMKTTAKLQGIDLRIVSATRNFSAQKSIWESKWNGSRKVGGKSLNVSMPDPKERAMEILKYSSMPGTSRHHWGTDIDINSVSPTYFDSEKGRREYSWLRDNAHLFGFCQVYSAKQQDNRTGYEEEKWHWSFLPIATTLNSYYNIHVTDDHLTGFSGSEELSFKDVLEYVNGISSKCK